MILKRGLVCDADNILKLQSTFMIYRFLGKECTKTYMSVKSNDDQRSNKIISHLYTSMNLVVPKKEPG
jgi:hypothetical protein